MLNKAITPAESAPSPAAPLAFFGAPYYKCTTYATQLHVPFSYLPRITGNPSQMPKVSGPLFSLRASGTLKKALTFATIQGRNIVRQYLSPADPRTAPQLAQRARVAEIAAAWNALDTNTRAAWQAAGASADQNGYSYFAQQWHLQDVHAPYVPSIP